jgi:prepilin-type N-terminal cleavage/methylation domain-containing protein
MKSRLHSGFTLLELLFALSLSVGIVSLSYEAWDIWIARHTLDVHMRQMMVLLATRNLLQHFGYEARLCHGARTCAQDPHLPYLLGVGLRTDQMVWHQFSNLGNVGTVWKFFGQSIWNAPINGVNKLQRTQNGSILFCQKGQARSALVINAQGATQAIYLPHSQLSQELRVHFSNLSRFCS